jgi:transcriptional regulator with XRE-family HTH domain
MNIKKLNRLKNKEYRDAFVGAHIDQGIAFQIKSIREQHGLTQEDLAKKLGLNSQSSIARYEDPSYGKLSITKIKELASAFDVAVIVKFVSYSRFLTEISDVSPIALRAKSFTQELPILEEDCDFVDQYHLTNWMAILDGSKAAHKISDESFSGYFEDGRKAESDNELYSKISNIKEKDYGDYEDCAY